MSIWKRNVTLDDLNNFPKETFFATLNITLTEIGDNTLKATMPVGPHLHQIDGILHGGASVALAESLGSIAALLCTDPPTKCVGQSINSHHLRPIKEGTVEATATPHHIGQKSQVWDIEIKNEDGKKISISRLTIANIQ